jgi:hypothetical protein
MRRTLLVLATVGATAAACTSAPDIAHDPRVGERGQLRFNGGGCSGSTTMAIGSRETLTLEAVEGSLPSELSARASDPDVIAAEMNEGTNEVTLRAQAAGQSRIEILANDSPYDALTFRAEAAFAAESLAQPRVLAGGSFDVAVTEVFGGCGTTECPLFGHSFLAWSTDPADALTLVVDDLGTATFIATQPQNVEVRAHEPALGNRIVSTSVSIEPLDDVTALAAHVVTIPLDDGEETITVQLPGSIPVGTAFWLRLEALRGELPRVGVSRRDVDWQVDGAKAVATDQASALSGDLFVAEQAGTVTFSANVELVGLEQSFELEIVE